ncbi:MAG: amino acid racemase [Bacteroidota bacterium]
MKTAGILGGLGPQSTALFYEEIMRLAQQSDEANYPPMIINSMSVWEFSQRMYDLDKLFDLVSTEIARIQPQVDFLAMVCNTAHSIIGPLREFAQVPLLAIQEEVVKKVRQKGGKKIGILGTKVTTGCLMYQEELFRYGLQAAWLPYHELESFNKLIFEKMLKGQSYDLMHLHLKRYATMFKEMDCDGVILGCTEFPLFLTASDVDIPLYPSTQILAESVFHLCQERAIPKVARKVG